MQTMSQRKAELYARYRLSYSDDAARFVLGQAGPECRTVADIGAGTGLLTQHFVGCVPALYAVEPEPQMRAVLERSLAGVVLMDGTAEATGLPDQSMDLLVVGNAYQRFHPVDALTEFARILRPGGWLAIFGYGFPDLPGGDLGARFPQWRARMAEKRLTKSPAHFFGQAVPLQYSFGQTCTETWDEYWGGVVSAMEAPDARDDWFGEFETAHRELFAQRAVEGRWTFPYSTEVLLGQPAYR